MKDSVDGHEEATRDAYDLVAEDYAALLQDHLSTSTWDRMVLNAFAEVVRAGDGGLVADVGCGPGRITGHLDRLGLTVCGVDLSPAMVAVAQRTHPHLRFEVGSMRALDFDDDALAGVVAWYSTIHTPPSEQPIVLRELARVLRPGGHLLLAFQVGDEAVHLTQAYGHDLSLDAYRLSATTVTAHLDEAGVEVLAQVLREPVEPERQPQAYLLARKRPAATTGTGS